MARITVEDCLDQLPNRFSLVLVSAERAKQLLRGAPALVDNPDENKAIVTALREIAAAKFNVDDSGVRNHDEHLPSDRRRTPAVVDELPPEY